jgi:hypothetical protein
VYVPSSSGPHAGKPVNANAMVAALTNEPTCVMRDRLSFAIRRLKHGHGEIPSSGISAPCRHGADNLRI